MLSAPSVVGPITPCSRHVRVEGLLPRATVRLFQNGTMPIGMTTAQMPFELVQLDATVQLEPGAKITATQETDNDTSAHSPVPYRVLLPPGDDAFDRMFFLAPPAQCGTCVWIGGAIPGAAVSIEFADNLPVSTVAHWTVAALHVSDGISAGSTAGPITVRQYGCGHDRGGTMTFPPPLKQVANAPDLLPPLFDPPPQACQQILHLTGIQPGAVVRIERENGTILSGCFGFTEGDIVLPDRGLDPNERLTIWQHYDGRECGRGFLVRQVRVEPGRPESPSFAVLPRAGDSFATLGNLVPGATVHVFRDDDPQPFLIGGATARVSTINLPGGWTASRLSVRQAVCDGGPFSEAAIERVRPAAPPGGLRLVGPIVANGAAVAVTGLDEPPGPHVGVNTGAHLRVFSKRWHGVIGEAIAGGDWRTTIDLWLPLLEGDEIRVEADRGGTAVMSAPVGTEPEPPSAVPLPPPQLRADQSATIDDCTGSVWAVGEPGTIVDVEEIPDPAFPADAIGFLLASVRYGGGRSLPVPPLYPDTLVRIRARHGGRRSDPGAAARVVDRGPIYRPGSTFRLSQLTGASDPVGRPHHQDTREISLRGTDLGIPVHHRGTLWVFFGDTDAFHFGPFEFYGDDDGFAWTEDDPEPDGPRLHFVTDDTDVFVDLLEEAIGALPGAGLGLALGLLVSQVGVVGALASGVTGAALGGLVGWAIDTVPQKRFRQLAVQGLPDLANFEVPTGGFSFDDRLFLFIAREKHKEKMRASHLAISAGTDPADNFAHVFNVSLMIDDLPAAEVPPHLDSADFKADRWLVHVSPVRVRNADWPGLPSDLGDGLLLFGTDDYQAANMRLAWAPLTVGQLPPPPEEWFFFMGEDNALGAWMRAADARTNGLQPHPLCPGNPNLGELSVCWSPGLRRWIMMGLGGHASFARRPWGPWTRPEILFDGADPSRAADNLAPDGSKRWVGLVHEQHSYRLTGAYAPYQVPRWMRVDRSVREAAIYYTLSVEHPPYNPQLLRSTLRGV